MKQGSFEIDLDTKESHVTIGEGHSANNQVKITITNNGNETSVRVTVGITCGATLEALLGAVTVRVSSATYSLDGSSTDLPLSSSSSSSKNSRSWQTSSRGVVVAPNKQMSILLSGFDSNTPPDPAQIAVLVQSRNSNNAVWSPSLKENDVLSSVTERLTVSKVAEGKPEDLKLHYFTVTPDYILHAGQTPVSVSFYTTGFKRITLYRNNQEVQNWPSNEPPANADGSITGVFADTPSITSVYRLEVKSDSNAEKPEQTRYRTVQVISPGWNQLALPQGYPTQLFVNQDFRGSGVERLYGIFIDGNNKAALYSSATGVDDWRLEPGDVPRHMATSPGVAYDNKLWLIGGSCVDPDTLGSEVCCYEAESAGEERKWNKKDGFPAGMTSRMGHACVVVNNKELWVLGGYSNGNYFNDVWKFDGSRWDAIQTETGQKKWPERYMHAATAFTPGSGTATAVWIYGGNGKDGAHQPDLWSTTNGKDWQEEAGIAPPPGKPLGTTLVTYHVLQAATRQRLFLGGTFLDAASSGESNRTSSFIFEWQWRNKKWEAHPVTDGWERFEGSQFYMQAIAFNRFLFVWSLHNYIDPLAPPKLNILIPS